MRAGRGSNQYRRQGTPTSPGRASRAATAAAVAEPDDEVEEIAFALHPNGPAWIAAGFRTPAAAAPWIDAGFTANEASRWRDWKFSPRTAAAWSGELFNDPFDAAGWRRAKFKPREASAWRSNGFGQTQSRQAQMWRDAGFDAGEAGRWHRLGFSVAGREAWRGIGVTEPGDAAQWQERKCRPEDAAPYVRQGLLTPTSLPDDQWETLQRTLRPW